MKKTMVLLFLLLSIISSTTFASLTTNPYQNYVKYTASVIQTTTTSNVTDTFPLGPFADVSFQCAWASITGTAPQYQLQTSNDTANWDDYTGGLVVTTGTSGSNTIIISSIPVKQARIKIAAASTTGNLTCVAVAHGR